MGYTHYWRRPKVLKNYNAFLADCQKIAAECKRIGLDLANGMGEGEATFDVKHVWFNGREKCGHEHRELGITWPSDTAGGIAKTGEAVANGSWFAGAKLDKRTCGGDCSHETFAIRARIKPEKWQQPEKGLYFDFCKTAYKPYDLAVISCLIALKHNCPEVEVSSDGEDGQWFDGKLLCQSVLGYGLEYVVGEDGLYAKIRKVEA